MKAYEAYLKSKKIEVVYIEATAEISDIRILIPELKQRGVDHIDFIDPVDNWLHKRLNTACDTCAIAMTRFDSPMFLNNNDELAAFFRTDKKKYHQTSFYTEQRKKRKVLIESDGKPAGGKWTFDTENRKKYPAKKTPPSVQFPDIDDYYIEAKTYVKAHFSDHLNNAPVSGLILSIDAISYGKLTLFFWTFAPMFSIIGLFGYVLSTYSIIISNSASDTSGFFVL